MTTFPDRSDLVSTMGKRATYFAADLFLQFLRLSLLHFQLILSLLLPLSVPLLPVHVTVVSAMNVVLHVSNAGVKVLNGTYRPRPHHVIPDAFASVCHQMKWDPQRTWRQLATPCHWYLHDDNASYIYLHNDGRFWLDDPNGAGIYVCDASDAVALKVDTEECDAATAKESDAVRFLVPTADAIWKPLTQQSHEPMPTVTVVTDK